MAQSKTPAIKVKRDYHGLSTPDLGVFAKGIKFTGDPDATSPPHGDTALSGKATEMLATNSLRLTDKSPSLRDLEIQQRNSLLDDLDDDANYVEIVARKVAKTAENDVNSGRAVVKRIGFTVAGTGVRKRNVGVVDMGIGWVHVHESKARKSYEGHVWEGGITTAKDVPPTVTKTMYNLESDCIFSGLPSGSIFAYRHASVLPVSHVAKSSGSATPQSSSAKKTSLIPKNKSSHPVFDFNNPHVYSFGEWHYVVIL
ncbi:MAG: hypothetical protein WCH34_13520 [Bacteroidota bacterium]